MSKPSHVILRRLFAIFAITAMLISGFAPVLAQQATPIVETPVATESPTAPAQVETPTPPESDAGTPSSIPETTNPTEVSTPQVPPAMISVQSDSMQPLVDVGGKKITLSSPDIQTCGDLDSNWQIGVSPPDESITSVTVRYSNGDIVSAPVFSSPPIQIAMFGGNSAYNVVDAWAYSSNSESTSALTINFGPCNDPIEEGAVYTATFWLHTPPTPLVVGELDSVTWVLTDSDNNAVDGGSLAGLEDLIISDLSNGIYQISFTDSSGQWKDLAFDFEIRDRNIERYASFYSVNVSTDYEILTYSMSTGSDVMVPGVTLSVTPISGGATLTGTTNEFGSYVFVDLPSGEYKVIAEKDGYVTTASGIFVDSVGQVNGLVYIEPFVESSITGFVADLETNQSIEGATITAVSNSELSIDLNTVGIETTSGEEGQFSFTNVYQDGWYLTIEAPGYQSVSAIVFAGPSGGVAQILMPPLPGVDVTLQITTSDSGSPEGATYQVTQGETVYFEGVVPSTGSVDLGNLPIGETYSVTIGGDAIGYANKTESFTVTTGQGTWNMTLDPITHQNVTLQVTTSDAGSAWWANYEVKLNEEVKFSGTLGFDGSVVLGDLPIGEQYLVTIAPEAIGYLGKTATFTVTAGQSIWTMEIDPITHQNVTLQIDTSDGGNPTGATYTVMHGEDELTSGTLDSTGTVPLGDLPIGETYEVAISAGTSAYLPGTETFTVAWQQDTWTMTIDPNTQEITVNVQTTDSGAVGGFFYNISGNAPGSTSGIMQFSNHIELGELQIGSEWSVFINGTNQGYEQKTVEFTVTEGESVWNITLAPLAPPTQNVTLEVDTSDSDNPTGASYTVMHGDDELTSGTLDITGTVVLGDLPLGEEYDVTISTGTSNYLGKTETFTTTLGQDTWTMTLEPIPTQNVTLRVFTVDGESTSGTLVTYQIGDGSIEETTLDAPGNIFLGEIAPDTPVAIWIDASGSGYQGVEWHFFVVDQQEFYDVTLQWEYSLTLQINTGSEDIPPGVRYTVTMDDRVLYSGGFPESGIVTLTSIPSGELLDITINGEMAGYTTQSDTYTAIDHTGTLTFDLEPLTTEPTTTDVTMRVDTSDGESPEGSTYVINQTEPLAAGSGFSGGPLLQVGSMPITGTIPADGIIVIPDLTIGATYLVSVDGEAAGYENLTTSFTVDSADPDWQITLQALQGEETETPTETPTTPAETPSPTATDVPATPTTSPEVTGTPSAPTSTVPAGTPDAPAEPDDSSTQAPVSGLPSTGSGSDSIATIILLTSGLMLIAIAAGLSIRRGKQG